MTDARTVEPVNHVMLDEIWGSIQYRQAKFHGETLETSVKVVLANYGDGRRIAHCVTGDWSGPKSELAQAPSGLPLCPRCHKPCTEDAEGWTLALVDGHNPWAGVDIPEERE